MEEIVGGWGICMMESVMACITVVIICTIEFNIQQFYSLPTQCIYYFLLYPTTNCDFSLVFGRVHKIAQSDYLLHVRPSAWNNSVAT